MSDRAVAQGFGDCIAQQDYDTAWERLSKELQVSSTPESIKNAITTMTAYASGLIQEARVMDDFTLDDWPDKQADDLAIVYVALIGEDFSEAVTLTLAKEGLDNCPARNGRQDGDMSLTRWSEQIHGLFRPSLNMVNKS